MDAQLTTTIFERTSRFTQVGTRLPDHLTETAEKISDGLSGRMRRHAIRRLQDAGFDVAGWDCEIYSLNADRIASERAYTVEFTNGKGGMLGIKGILNAHGWPTLDHGICAGIVGEASA